VKRRNLNYHKKVCKKYMDSKLSPLEKEAVFGCGPSIKPKKMKFAGIGRNPRKSGRKAHKVHQCKECDLMFTDARARV